MKKRTAVKRFLTMMLAAFLTFSTIGGDALVINATGVDAEEEIEEEEIIEEEAPVQSEEIFIGDEKTAVKPKNETPAPSSEAAEPASEEIEDEVEEIEEEEEVVSDESEEEGTLGRNLNPFDNVTVTYYGNGGSLDRSIWGWGWIYEEWTDITYDEGDTFTFPGDNFIYSYPSKNGYNHLKGWSTKANPGSGDKIYLPGEQYKITKDVNFYAIYEHWNTALFRDGGITAKGNTQAAGNIMAAPGSEITLPATTTLKNPTNECSFAGWSDSKNFPQEGKFYAPGSKYKLNVDNTIFYSVWKEKVTFYILTGNDAVSTDASNFYPVKGKDYNKFMGYAYYIGQNYPENTAKTDMDIKNFLVEIPENDINKYLTDTYGNTVSCDDIRWYRYRTKRGSSNEYSHIDGILSNYPVKVVYDAGEGIDKSGSHTRTETATANKPYDILGNDVLGFTKEGYKLSGWSLTKGGSPVGTSFVPTEKSTTLYAVWTENEKVTYTVSYRDELGNNIIPAKSAKVKDPTYLNKEDFVNEVGTGYTADSSKNDLIDWKVTADNNEIVLYYTADVYDLEYDLDGGTVSGNPENYTIRDTVVLNKPEKPGYTFQGWQKDGETGLVKEVTIAAGSTGNKKYTAKYTENNASIFVNWSTASTGAISYQLSNLTQLFGAATGRSKAITAPKMEGYIFAGCYLYTTDTRISGNETLTVEEIDKYAKTEGVYNSSTHFMAVYNHLALMVKAENIDVTYTGETFAIAPVAYDELGNVSGATYKYFSDENCTKEIANSFVNVSDSKEVYVKAYKSEYVKGQSEPVLVTVKINKAVPEFELSPVDGSVIGNVNELIYGGKSSAEFDIVKNSSNGTISFVTEPADVNGIITVKNEDGRIIVKADKNASDGNIVVKVISTDTTGNYENAEIELLVSVAKGKIENVEVIGNSDSIIYDGEAHKIEVTADDTVDGAPEVKYCVVKDGMSEEDYIYSSTVPEFVDAGTYTVAYLVSKDGFEDVKGTASLTILPKEVTIEWSSSDLVYNGEKQVYDGAAIVGLLDADKSVTLTIEGNEGKNAGLYTATVTGITSGNYKFSPNAQTETEWKIYPRPVELKWSATDGESAHSADEVSGTISVIYSGNGYEATAEITNLVEGDVADVTYGNNEATEPGSYNCTAVGVDNENYTIDANSNSKVTLVISYLEAEPAVITGTKGNGDWFVADTKLSKDGFEISTDNGLTWSSEIEILDDTAAGEITYIMKNAKGYITDAFKADYKYDATAPVDVTIDIENNKFMEVLNNVTFGLFFKKTVEVTISAEDATSNMGTYEYQVVASEDEFDADGTWESGDKFSLDPVQKFIVYARAIDNAGNKSEIINSKGVVLYKDAEAETDAIEYIKGSKEDKKADVELNGNEIGKISIIVDGDEIVLDENDYTVENGTITFDGDFLETLEGSENGTEYEIVITINPAGEVFTEGTEPEKISVKLTVILGKDEITIGSIGKTYDGNSVEDPEVTLASKRTNYTVEYRDAKGTVLDTAPFEAGKYSVMVSIDADETYASANATKEFEIIPKEVTLNWKGADSVGHTAADFKFTYSALEYTVEAVADGVVDGDRVLALYSANDSVKKASEVGEYKAVVTGIDNANYVLSDNACKELDWSIAYLEADAAEITGTKGYNDWFVADTKLSKDGFDISTDGVNYLPEIEITDDTAAGKITYTMKNGEGYITDSFTAEYKYDSTTPSSPVITIEGNSFKTTLNKITFGLFFKKTVEAVISDGSDETSGVNGYEYQVVASEDEFDADGTWESGDKFSLDPVQKFVVYARTVDNAGNKSIIVNSDGVVLYADSRVETDAIEYIKGSEEDKKADVELNGNEIGKISIIVDGDEIVLDENDYTVENGTITFDGDFLETLEGSENGTEYEIVITINPAGEELPENAEPETLKIKLTVVFADEEITIGAIGRTYNGQPIDAPSVTTKSGRTDYKVEYKKANEDDSAYTEKAPVDAGDYVVRVSTEANETFKAASATKEFSITAKEVTLSWIGSNAAGSDFTDFDFTYNNAEYYVKAVVEGTVANDNVAVKYTDDSVCNASKVGSYTAAVEEIDNANYVLSANAQKELTWSISYLKAEPAVITGTKGNKDWFVADTKLSKDGFKISTNGNDWFDQIDIDADTAEGQITYTMKDADGFITDEFTSEVYKYDSTAPVNVTIDIENNKFTEALNKVTFGIFFKKTVNVTISAEDVTSGMGTYEYQVVASEDEFDANGTWTSGDKFSLDPVQKFIVYARAIDNAGNKSAVINSDGVVLYKDSKVGTDTIEYVKGSKEDQTAEVELNGNEIGKISIIVDGDEIVLDEDDYTVENGTITFDGDFLETLEGSENGTEYEIVITINPAGEELPENAEPETLKIKLNVVLGSEEISFTDINAYGKVYDNTPIGNPKITVKSGRTDEVVFEYKKAGEDDSAYTTDAPVNAGEYVVRASIKAGGTFGSASVTGNFEITRREVTISWIGLDNSGNTTQNFDFVYNGYDYEVKAQLDNVASGDQVSLSYDNDSVLKAKAVNTYKAVVTEISDTDNYVLSANAQTELDWSISYLKVDADAKVEGAKIIPDGEWFTGEVSVSLDGYQISSDGNVWADKLIFKADTDDGVVNYYLKNSEGYITDLKTVKYKLDQVEPEVTIEINDNFFTKIFNALKGEFFFKDTVDVKISTSDATPGSGVGVYGIKIVDAADYENLTAEEVLDKDGWQFGTDTVTVEANKEFVAFALVEDIAGHSKVVNTDNIVVFTNSEAVTDEVLFVRSGKAEELENKEATVKLNGNTIKGITIDGQAVSADDYTVNDGVITLKGSFLNTLEGSADGVKHEVVVSYNPSFGTPSENGLGKNSVLPSTTAFTVVVKKHADAVAITNDISKTYNGKTVKEPQFTVDSGREVVIEYKKAGEDDSAYTTTAPKAVGNYVVRVSVAEDDNYVAASAEKDFKIKKKSSGGGGGSTGGNDDGGNGDGGNGDGGNGDGGNDAAPVNPNPNPAPVDGNDDAVADNDNNNNNNNDNNDAAEVNDDDETVIDDEDVPTKDKIGETQIDDEEVPLDSSLDESKCYVHWTVMILTILFAIYSLIMIAIRAKKLSDLKDNRREGR
ncbi:MAG: MBG domain-containing protein [Lachnospiraceae bacterium]|nr:MBG domain-containing protein [Lachnospiraceae bacterium]